MQTNDLAANAAQSPVSTPSTKSSPTNRSARLRWWPRRGTRLVAAPAGAPQVSIICIYIAASGAAPERLTIDRLQLTLGDVRPLQQIVNISEVELTALHLHITCNRAGQLNVLPAVTADATKNIAAYARKTGAISTNDLKNVTPAAASAAPPWKVTVGSVAVRGGKLSWHDETLAPAAQIALANLSLDASGIALPFVASAPMRLKRSLALDPAALAPANAAAGTIRTPRTSRTSRTSQIDSSQLNFSGFATEQAAAVTADLSSWRD